MYGLDTYRDAWVYALAAHVYYHGNGQDHVMEDNEYDALTTILRMNWADIPLELQEIFISPERIGQGSNHIVLNDEQLKYAWYIKESI
jgi:REP element-mobilizing transposase RayT